MSQTAPQKGRSDLGEVNDAHLPVKTVFKNGGHVIGFLSAQSIE
jgi:hypothetical protein